MGESRVEIVNRAGEIGIPTEICCNCASPNRITTVLSDLKLTRYLGMGGSEYTFRWRLPYCPECQPTAERSPVGKLHVALVIGLATVGLFLALVVAQIAMDESLFGGNDFWVALAMSALLVAGFYSLRRPRGTQSSYYQPVRIRKLRQKFASGEVTGIVLGFTNPIYGRRFQELNEASSAG